MAKLHELLIVEGQRKGQATTVRTELMATFDKKPHLFEEKLTTFKPIAEGAPVETVQQLTLQTTVGSELAWLRDKVWAPALDTSLLKEVASTIAKGDVILDDGTKIMSGVPVLALLELEKRASEMQELVAKIKTLDPAKGFKPDPSKRAGAYIAHEVRKERTKKIQDKIVLLEPTKEHPGQAQLINVDVKTGDIIEQEWSGLITPSEKADMIARAEELQRAIKQARMRASEVLVPEFPKYGADLLTYVFEGTTKAVP